MTRHKVSPAHLIASLPSAMDAAALCHLIDFTALMDEDLSFPNDDMQDPGVDALFDLELAPMENSECLERPLTPPSEFARLEEDDLLLFPPSPAPVQETQQPSPASTYDEDEQTSLPLAEERPEVSIFLTPPPSEDEGVAVETPRRRKSSAKRKRCPVCLGTYVRLVTHMAMHDSSPKFYCDECGRGFRQRITLTRHMDVHAEERLGFPCPDCDKVLSRKDKLKEHRPKCRRSRVNQRAGGPGDARRARGAVRPRGAVAARRRRT